MTSTNTPESPSRRGSQSPSASRCGAVLLEGVFVLGVFLVLLISMLDLGLAVLRYNCLSEAARKLAREAIVHGEMASPQRTAWGPDASSGNAGDGSEPAAVMANMFVATDPADVLYQITWPDGGNAVDQRVQVTLSNQYQPIVSLPFLGDGYTLHAVSTLRIAH